MATPSKPFPSEDFSQYRLGSSPHQLGLNFSDFTNILNVVDNTWNTLKSIFSFNSTSTIVSNITSLGFDSWSETSLIQSYVGIPEEKLDDFKSFISKSVEVPVEKQDAFKEMWDWAAFTESGTWQYDNTAYTKDNAGNAKYVTVLYSKDFTSNKYTFFVADIQGTFSVAEDMFVWQKQKSMFGGLFQSDNIEFQFLPHKISPEDATVIMNFFDIVALAKYDMYLKMFINKTFPTQPTLRQPHVLPTFLE